MLVYILPTKTGVLIPTSHRWQFLIMEHLLRQQVVISEMEYIYMMEVII